MKRISFFVFAFLSALLLQTAYAGFAYHDFETAPNAWAWNGTCGLSSGSEPARGTHSLKLSANNYWGGFGLQAKNGTWDTSFDISKNERLTFWLYAVPQAGGNHNAAVKFFDNNKYASGFEVWTTKTAAYARWSRLEVLFSQLPADFDLAHVNKLEFAIYNPGVFYFDDINVVREDRLYQTFEPEQRSGSVASEYGWKWLDADTVGFSASSEPVYEGAHSWKLGMTQKFNGTGIQSQEKRFYNNGTSIEQSFWHVDLHPEKNNRLALWVYSQGGNGLDNNLCVQFYDNAAHSTDATKAYVWTKQGAVQGKWTRIVIPFSQLPKTLNLHDLNKIQVQFYYPGTYYIDDILACPAIPKIYESYLASGTLKWSAVSGAGKYIVEESRVSANGPWVNAYSGTALSFKVNHVSKMWYRVRWEEAVSTANTIPYQSQWSDIAQYDPAPMFISKTSLVNGLVEWPKLNGAQYYEVQMAAAANGPWSRVYYGAYSHAPISSGDGLWYRVRAVRVKSGAICESTPWSDAQSYAPAKGFLKVSGQMFKDANGAGKQVILQGVNLGGLLLIEPWLNGIGEADGLIDDWSIRDALTSRFGEEQVMLDLYGIYQDSYINNIDFDRIKRSGINVVRLPIFYRLLQDDNGNWVRDSQGQIDFSRIDRIVNACADRNIYVLLDLHGAPGAQNPEATTGRANFNKLFLANSEGAAYRNRTIQIWKAIAQHYKNNTAVCGYDLLNEPYGAPAKEVLWTLYGKLYTAIRAVDPNHIIVMEGIWGWDTLPLPSAKNWKNVAYQFHYYLWDHNEDFQAHKDFIDLKVAETKAMEVTYKVPVMIGEFHGFGLKSIWDYYLSNFAKEKYSWMVWNYKCHYPASEWGVYNHNNYPYSEVNLFNDTYDNLVKKFKAYASADYHVQNQTLSKILGDNLQPPVTTPFIRAVGPETVLCGNDFYLSGNNFGAAKGSVFFSGSSLPVISWSAKSIHAYIPSSVHALCGMVSLQTSAGKNSNEIPLQVIQPPQVTSVVPSAAARAAQITISGTGFGNTKGEIQFYPAPATPQPGQELPNGMAKIISWSDSVIKCIVPADAISGPVTIRTPYGNTVFTFSVQP